MKTNSCLILCSLFVVLLLHRAVCTTSENGCPDKSSKWKDLGGDFCYLIEMTHTATWIDAVYNCFTEGGSLASFHSIEEVLRVVHHINHERIRYYIGLWKHYDGSLEWVDKSALDFRNWNHGEPNFDYEKCVEMYYHSGKWNDLDCSSEIGYICSSPKMSSSQPPRGPRKVCPYHTIKWEHFGGEVCYIVETQKKARWTDALYRCSEEGGSLASFHSIEEISAVLRRTKDYDERLHIGLRRTEHGKHIWTDGSPLDLDYWKTGEPNNDERSCAEMNAETGQWYDVHCEKRSGYICSSLKDFCGGDIYSGSGYIYSPEYPQYTGTNNCTWGITVPEDQQVVLQFQTFELEGSNNCRYDFVEVRDGHESGSPVLGKFCGSSSPFILRSSKNKMAVRFVTDGTDNGIGFAAKFTKAGICGEDIFAENGVLESPNFPRKYGPGEYCVWHVTLPENDTVSLKFSMFDVASSTGCREDFVEIRDGDQMTSPVLGKLCGSDLPRLIRATGNKLTVVFASDLSVEKFGFLAEFQKGCSVEDIVSESGVISSPNYPENYENDEICTWKITVPENHQVVLQFISFDLEQSPACIADSVTIRDGHESGSPLLGKFCGESVPEIIRSSTNKMSVTFVADNNAQKRGFIAAHLAGILCGGDIVAEKGVLQSPNFPNNYGPGLKCVWNITVPENYKISLKFLAFDVKTDDFCRDFVIIIDGYESGGRILGTFCGPAVPESIISTANTMTVVFISDYSGERTGFTAEFEKDVCGGDISSDSGIISSPNFPNSYRRNEACTWKITVPVNYQVFLQFHSFDLEGDDCIYDFVAVRDGHEDDSPFLGKFCGTDIPETIRSSKNKISVTFWSDTSYQRKGFNATFRKDNTAYEHLEFSLRELPILVLQHKVPKAKEKITTKQGKPSKNSLEDLLHRVIKP